MKISNSSLMMDPSLFDNKDSFIKNQLEKNNLKEKINSSGKKDPAIDEKAMEVAKDFETIFIDMMLKSMRNTAKPEDESNAENIYSSMLDNEYSKAMTNNQNFGIREMVYEFITRNNSDTKI